MCNTDNKAKCSRICIAMGWNCDRPHPIAFINMDIQHDAQESGKYLQVCPQLDFVSVYNSSHRTYGYRNVFHRKIKNQCIPLPIEVVKGADSKNDSQGLKANDYLIRIFTPSMIYKPGRSELLSPFTSRPSNVNIRSVFDPAAVIYSIPV